MDLHVTFVLDVVVYCALVHNVLFGTISKRGGEATRDSLARRSSSQS